MNIQQENILSLIPQRPPFVMIDALRYVDEKITVGVLIVPEDNIFVQDKLLTEPGLIENMAQTAAAGIGYICKTENRAVPIGYLGAIQQLAINGLPVVGDEIETVITVENQVFDATIVSATIKCNGLLLANCHMKIFIKRKL